MWCTRIDVQTGPLVHASAVVFTSAVAHAGTVVYTGAAVQIATYMLFLPVLGHP